MIIKELIDNTYKLSEEYGNNNNPKENSYTSRAISVFYGCYAFSLSVLGLKCKHYSTICSLWKKSLLAETKEKKAKYITKIRRFMREDILIIMEAQEKLRELKKTDAYSDDTIASSDAFAILSYEHPSNMKEDD